MRISRIPFSISVMMVLANCAPVHLNSREATFDHIAAVEALDVCGTSEGRVRYFSEKNALCLNGEIDIQGAMLQDIRNVKGIKKGVMVVIKSSGGGLEQSIKIVEVLEKYGYSIAVDGVCVSACAQFIFFGAKAKYISGNGFVGIHGGPIPYSAIDNMNIPESGKSNLRREQELFRKFFRDRMIDMEICVDAPASVKESIRQGKTVFWMPTHEQFNRYGVVNIVNLGSNYLK